MALAQFNVQVDQERLAKTFGTRPGVGTPFSRIKRLEQWPVNINIKEWGGVEELISTLATGASIITAVTTTAGLPGWGQIRTQHTLLVVNVDADYVTYHDPALAQGPVSALRPEFLLAWSHMAEQVAFVTRR
jgi:predicted double-glycine peptidase